MTVKFIYLETQNGYLTYCIYKEDIDDRKLTIISSISALSNHLNFKTNRQVLDRRDFT